MKFNALPLMIFKNFMVYLKQIAAFEFWQRNLWRLLRRNLQTNENVYYAFSRYIRFLG